MELSLLMAKLLGVVYIVVGLGMLINKDGYKDMMGDIYKNSLMLYMGGVMALVVGLLLVMYHNLWVSSWEVIITILGWLALLKGLLLLLAPKAMKGMVGFWEKNIQFGGVIVLILGLVLGYFGFVA
ncbi:MAG: hypothetical protein ABH856_02325 [Patescibacteria group bacterium]|nr:hypothetical protein [Patescibacteria group bacterium]